MNFDCEEALHYVDAWVDGELDPGAAMHVEVHLRRCDDCRAEADVIRTLKASFASLREADHCPASVRANVLAALDAEDARCEQAHVHEAQDARTRSRRHAAGFTVAGVAIAAGVMALAHPARHDGMDVASAGMFPSVMEDIAQRHARDLPSEVQGDRPDQVTSFFRGRVDVPVRPVMFRGVQAHLVGARISNVRDRTAAALYYDVGGRRMTVFVFDRALLPQVPEAVANRVMYVGNVHGYTVAFSEHGGVGYAVASDLSAQDTVRIAERAEIQ